jgi:Sec7-like guanine-nucleotide exchange factor
LFPPKEKAMSELNAKERHKIPDSKFAFPKERKEPIENASHVRNAIARFDQVEGVSNKEKDEAWERIKKAAKKYGVEVHERSWHELGKKK